VKEMPWWAWLAVGAVILIIEVAVQTEFWLAVLGGAALMVGAVGWVIPEQPVWVQWAQLGVFSILLTVFVRRRLHEKFVGRAPGIAPDLIGESVIAQETIEPGGTGSVQHRGSVWQARNVGESAIATGHSARIERVDGVALDIRT
jgi:membrane protein implicated in regulation of membrane protease activity